MNSKEAEQLQHFWTSHIGENKIQAAIITEVFTDKMNTSWSSDLKNGQHYVELIWSVLRLQLLFLLSKDTGSIQELDKPFNAGDQTQSMGTVALEL